MFTRLVLGSNVLTNFSGVVRVRSEDLIALEVDPDTGLLLTTEIFDEHGEHVAKLRRNAWTFNHPGYEIRTNPSSLQLVGPDGVVRFDASVSDGEVVVSRASLFSRDGDELQVDTQGFQFKWAESDERIFSLVGCTLIGGDPEGTAQLPLLHIKDHTGHAWIQDVTFAGPGDFAIAIDQEGVRIVG